MPTRLDPLRVPEHLQFLIDNGLIWRSGTQVLQHAMRELQNGNATRKPEKEPTPEIRAFLDKVAPIANSPLSPLQSDPLDEAEPVEEPAVETTAEEPTL